MLKSYSPRAAAWTAPEINMAADASLNFWQGKICTPLAILLRKAGYSLETQYAHMRFFLDCTVPALGPACLPSGSILPWQSFMTDDHTPVELSWEWGHTGEDPRIRYALEPIGFSAGGCLDPLNLQASRNLIKELQHTVPNLNLRWYNHCAERLLPNNHAPDSQHAALLGKFPAETSSSSFIAYDLRRKGPMTVKAYFLPSVRATHSKVSNFDLIVQAIRSLPEARAGAFQALELLTEFTQKDPLGSALECDILGIDCVPEEYARLKIYLRSRCTSFDSVRSIMTLGGRIQSPENERAFRDLFELWQALFFPGKQQVTSTGGDLQPCAHRTAGVLYYFDFSKTKPKPVPKVYLPVRHYGKSDYLIATALCTYMKRRDKQQEARQYLSALEEIL
ncbi:putative 4-O-dimethylallyl-L-tyrosine synthase [Microsporum audouinii]